jgi:hypothetical protein
MGLPSPRQSCFLPVLALVVGCEAGGEMLEPAGPLPPAEADLAVRLRVPEDHPGNPFYALIFNGLTPESPDFFFPHSDEWGAAAFERRLECVPPDFNLLEEFDFTPAFPGGPPRPFLCPLTVSGYQIWHNPPDPLPVDPGPVFVMSRGLGAVPVVFARWDEIEEAMADLVLTLPELLALPSAMVGLADHFVATYVNGPPPDDRLLNKVSASGLLPDGRSFRVQGNESEAGTRYHVEIR